MRHSDICLFFCIAVSTALYACGGDTPDETTGGTSSAVAIGEPDPNGNPSAGGGDSPGDPSDPGNPSTGRPSTGGGDATTPADPTRPRDPAAGRPTTGSGRPSTDPANPSGGPSTGGGACGPAVCGVGTYCCDPLHGRCAKLGMVCAQ